MDLGRQPPPKRRRKVGLSVCRHSDWACRKCGPESARWYLADLVQFRKSLLYCFAVDAGLLRARKTMVNRRKRKSGAAKAASAHTTDAHERDSCGYYLADRGTDLRTMQDYLGHRDPRHTVHYTRVAGRRFEGLWK
jgi:site-specific recombinase XerD